MKRAVNLIVIHCSATRENQDYSFDQLVRDHQARGFKTCGYHRYIKRDGRIYNGRDFDQVGAHVQGHNTLSIGICYEGGLDVNGKAKDTRTEAQKKALLQCISEAMRYGTIRRITGHRDLSPDTNNNGVVEPHEWTKNCPCFDTESEYKCLLDIVP